MGDFWSKVVERFRTKQEEVSLFAVAYLLEEELRSLSLRCDKDVPGGGGFVPSSSSTTAYAAGGGGDSFVRSSSVTYLIDYSDHAIYKCGSVYMYIRITLQLR